MSDFPHHETLDYTKSDRIGYIPTVAMINKRYFHSKTQRLYEVIGFIWDSDLDRWKIHYQRAGCVIRFTRLPDVFNDGRFVEVLA